MWSSSVGGCHVNLVVLDAGTTIAAHRNDAVDVELVVLDGTGTATVDDEVVALAPMTALLIRRGTTRETAAGSDGLRYLTIHAERPSLAIGTKTDASRTATLGDRVSAPTESAHSPNLSGESGGSG